MSLSRHCERLGLAFTIFEQVANLLHFGLELCDPTTKLLHPRAPLATTSRITSLSRLTAGSLSTADAFSLAQLASTALGLGALDFLRHVHLIFADDPAWRRVVFGVDREIHRSRGVRRRTVAQARWERRLASRTAKAPRPTPLMLSGSRTDSTYKLNIQAAAPIA